MRITKREWKAIGQAVLQKALENPDNKRFFRVSNIIGLRGELAAEDGVDPADGPPRYLLIQALRTVVACANRIDEAAITDEFLKAMVGCEGVLDLCDGLPVR
jgi:hypothetical protein